MNENRTEYEQLMAALGAGDLATTRHKVDRLRYELEELDRPDRPVSVAVRSRAARAAATAHRLTGDLAGAEGRVREAIDLAAHKDNTDVMVAIEAELELGDLRRAQRRPAACATAYRRAERLAERAGLPRLLRWKIELRSIDQQLTADPALGVERLTALAAELPDVPADALDALPPPMRELLRAVEPIASGDGPAALQALEGAASVARNHEDIPIYVAARIAAAHVNDDAGERAGAYLSVAKGWATLRVAVDAELARAAFEPTMQHFRDRWGLDEFERAKAGVEGR